MGLMSRRKGRKWEQELALMFRKIFGSSVRRTLAQSRDGNEAPDLDGVPELWVEAKHRKIINIHAAMKQAKEGAIPAAKRPVVVSKRNYDDPMATMLLSDFLWLLNEWQQGQHYKPLVGELTLKIAQLEGKLDSKP